jgi:hypothetical protein
MPLDAFEIHLEPPKKSHHLQNARRPADRLWLPEWMVVLSLADIEEEKKIISSFFSKGSFARARCVFFATLSFVASHPLAQACVVRRATNHITVSIPSGYLSHGQMRHVRHVKSVRQTQAGSKALTRCTVEMPLSASFAALRIDWPAFSIRTTSRCF